jgi:hypothetical protein
MLEQTARINLHLLGRRIQKMIYGSCALLTLSISLIWLVVFVVPVAFSLFVFLLKVNIS